MLHLIAEAGNRALDAVTESFSPRPGASPRDVRVNGAICVGIGFLCMASLLGGIYVLGGLLKNPDSHAMMFLLLPAFLGYAFLIVGGYRLVFGVSVKATADEVSLFRILFGVLWILFLFATPLVVLILFG